MLKNWQGLESIDVRKLTDAQCREWANRYVKQASPTNYNNTLIVLRSILEIAVEQGFRYNNPAANLKRARTRQKDMRLPGQSRFPAWSKRSGVCRMAPA
jgi:hypothetical protein